MPVEPNRPQMFQESLNHNRRSFLDCLHTDRLVDSIGSPSMWRIHDSPSYVPSDQIVREASLGIQSSLGSELRKRNREMGESSH